MLFRSLLNEMINAEDYYPPYLFKISTSGIKSQLLEKFLQSKDIETDLFKSIVWLIEKGPCLEDKLYKDMKEVTSKYRRYSLTIKKGVLTSREDGFKKTLLGNVNIVAQGESWPMCDNVALSPVIQLAMSNLPYIPKELEGIKYLCIYIHPDDPAALLERDDALVIRAYTSENLEFINVPNSFAHERQPTLLEFEKVNDYPCDYQYPNIKDYLSYLGRGKYYSKGKSDYDWKADFSNNFEVKPWEANDCKILGWTKWIQWPEEPEDSTLILQIDNDGLWDYGDTSRLYIFRNNITKEFSGFIQIF